MINVFAVFTGKRLQTLQNSSLHKKRFPNYFQFFFQNQNSARFYNFDLFKRNHSAKKHKFHEKNRKTAYMLRKWALFHASGGISKIQVGLSFFVFLRRAIFLQFLAIASC